MVVINLKNSEWAMWKHLSSNLFDRLKISKRDTGRKLNIIVYLRLLQKDMGNELILDRHVLSHRGSEELTNTNGLN